MFEKLSTFRKVIREIKLESMVLISLFIVLPLCLILSFLGYFKILVYLLIGIGILINVCGMAANSPVRVGLQKRS